MEKMSPDVFLSRAHCVTEDGSVQNGVAYESFPWPPTVCVAALVQLSAMRTWDEESKQFLPTVYHTPGFKPVEQTAGLVMDRRHGALQSIAYNRYLESLHSGDLETVYTAVDDVNRMRERIGGVELVPQSDFEIVAHKTGVSPLGYFARMIISLRATDPVDMPAHGLLPWFDTKEGFDQLAVYGVQLQAA